MKVQRPSYRMIEEALKVELDLVEFDRVRRQQRTSGTTRSAPFPMKLDGMKKELVRFYRWVVETMERVADAANQNEGSAIVIEQGGVLPTASIEYVGRLAHLSKTAAVDELWWCRKTAGGGYEWKQVQIVP